MKNTDKDLTKRFTNTYIFYDKDINVVIMRRHLSIRVYG